MSEVIHVSNYLILQIIKLSFREVMLIIVWLDKIGSGTRIKVPDVQTSAIFITALPIF